MLETHSLNKGLRPAARSAPGGLLEMQVSGPTPTQLDQDLHFPKLLGDAIPAESCTLTLEKHHSRPAILSLGAH